MTGARPRHDDTCFAGLRTRGIDAFEWNLAIEDPPFDRRFDAIFIWR